MVVLGLGSNVGDRLKHLRLALSYLRQLKGLTIEQVSPVYVSDALLPAGAPPDWDKPHLNLSLRCETHLSPIELLISIKKIEEKLGRHPQGQHWGPRQIDIDILVWDNLIIEDTHLTIPHPGLTERPFALWPLADVAPFWVYPLTDAYHGQTAAQIVKKWGSRFTGLAPLKTRQILQRVDGPQLVGIINVTPDSFSDGGLFLNPEKALEQVRYLVESGAEVIDIGAESTAPAAKSITHHEEWVRLKDVLSAINNHKNQIFIPPKLSIDTYHPQTAAKALDLGIDWINDVSGLKDPNMQDLVAKTNVNCVIMHHLSLPASPEHLLPQNQDPTTLVYEWGQQRLAQLAKLGIDLNRIIFDPGISFGKSPEQSLALLKNAHQFKSLGVDILIGHSRKSFLTSLTPANASARDVETQALSLSLANQGIDYLRLHNVEMTARGLKIWRAL